MSDCRCSFGPNKQPMKHVYGLGLLLVSSGTIQAQEIRDTATVEVTLPEAMVLGVDFDRQDLLEAPKAAVALDPSEWSTGASITEALEFIPGVDVQSRGAWGIQTDVSIRGGTFEQVGLRVDGMRWSAPHTGHHLMNIPLDPEDLSHVEAVRSGAGPWAGVGAFSGALLMESRVDASANRASFTAEIGSFDWQRLRAHCDWQTGTAQHGLSLSRASTSGHVTNSDAEVQRLFYGVRWDWASWKWKGLLAGETKAFGAQNFYTAVYPNQHEETGAAVAQLTGEWTRGAWRTQLGMHGRVHQDRFELFREGLGWYNETEDGFYVAQLLLPDTAGLYAPGVSWYPGANEHRSFVAAANALVQWRVNQWSVTGAADVRSEAIRSNRLGTGVGMEDATDPYVLGDGRQNLDGYLAAQYRGSGWNATGTFGLNANSRFGTYALPALQVSKSVGGAGRVFASAGRSVRHPSFTDLYYNLGGAVGSENLLPEQADQAEVGARWGMDLANEGQLILETTRFYRRGTNLIDWVRYDGSSIFEATNVTEVDFWGGDLTAQYRQPATSGLHIPLARISATWMDANRTSSGFTSNYVLDFMRVKYDALVRVAGLGPVEWTVRGSLQERNGAAMQWEQANLLSLWGTELSFQGEDGDQLAWRGHVRLDNLFDVRYADRGQVLQPGRMVRFGLTFEWNQPTN